MMYEYRISAWNRYGRDSARQLEPEQKKMCLKVSPPRWTKMDHLDDVIVLSWKKPIQSNRPWLVFKIKMLYNPIKSIRNGN